MRRPLGRGLDVLIDRGASQNSEESGAPRTASARLDQITAGPFQPRTYFNGERLGELVRAIRSQGVIEPLVVRPASTGDHGAGPRYELIAGERRLRAARMAGLEEVPIVIRNIDDRGALEMSLVENLAREDLNSVEEARGLERLNRQFGLSHEEIAKRIGKSRPYVTNAIRLLSLPELVLDMIARGKLSMGQARPLLALPPEEACRVAERGISARSAEELAGRRRRAAGRQDCGSAGDANLAALAENLQRCFRRKVRIVRRQGRKPGRIELDYYDDNDLTALAAALMEGATLGSPPAQA